MANIKYIEDDISMLIKIWELELSCKHEIRIGCPDHMTEGEVLQSIRSCPICNDIIFPLDGPIWWEQIEYVTVH